MRKASIPFCRPDGVPADAAISAGQYQCIIPRLQELRPPNVGKFSDSSANSR